MFLKETSVANIISSFCCYLANVACLAVRVLKPGNIVTLTVIPMYVGNKKRYP